MANNKFHVLLARGLIGCALLLGFAALGDAQTPAAPAATTAPAAEAPAAPAAPAAGAGAFKSLDGDVQGLKKEVLDLNKDLFLLEEELLFPANTQVAVFVSLDV